MTDTYKTGSAYYFKKDYQGIAYAVKSCLEFYLNKQHKDKAKSLKMEFSPKEGEEIRMEVVCTFEKE